MLQGDYFSSTFTGTDTVYENLEKILIMVTLKSIQCEYGSATVDMQSRLTNGTPYQVPGHVHDPCNPCCACVATIDTAL